MLEFTTAKAARDHLRSLGMVKNYVGFGKREYWWFTDRKNALLDHSATMSPIEGRFFVSNFYKG